VAGEPAELSLHVIEAIDDEIIETVQMVVELLADGCDVSVELIVGGVGIVASVIGSFCHFGSNLCL